MENKTTNSYVRRFFQVAYRPSSDPKKPRPGPLYDIAVVGLFMVLAIGYALT